MSRYIAFLRAINVGGHTVKMEDLRRLFEGMGHSSVETFIASGNVIFESEESSAARLEEKIEEALHSALGYEVATFLRTPVELAQAAAYRSFPPDELEQAGALNVAFLKAPLDEEQIQKLMALRTEIDDFHPHGREMYWKCAKKQSESTFSNALFEKKLRIQATFRGINTVQKMAGKYEIR
jgi:uncharacterized protein (DUF1697 family)